MKKIIFSLTVLLILSLPSFGQLSGTYTIGSSGNYSTVVAAVNALNTNGINGNVTFNIASGTYTGSLTLNNFVGNTQYNVVFQSATQDSTDVIIQQASGTSSGNNFALRFNQAKNIEFKHLTLQRSGTSNYCQVISIESSSSYISFTSCIIKNNASSLSDDFASLLMAKNLSNSNSSHIKIKNSKLQNGSYGVFVQGLSSGILANGLELEGNIFDSQYRTAIYAAYQNAPKILSNEISSSSSYSLFRGIDFLYCNYDSEVSYNKISINKGNGISMTNSQGLFSIGEIFNNFISVGGSSAKAIFFSNTGTFNIYFNSINVYGSSAVGFSVNGSTSNHLRFANNILYSAQSNELMQVASSTNIPFDYLNYNNYKTAGNIGDWKTTSNISSLAAWKTACGQDASSISENPNFVSNTDLHIQNSNVQRAGTSTLNAPYPNDDIDQGTRHNLTPDMGAHEYSFDDLELSALSVENHMCVGAKHSVKFTLKNNSNYTLSTTNIPVKYKMNNNTVSELLNISNLQSGDSVDYVFTQKITAPAQGVYPIEAWISLNSDDVSSNDSIVDTIQTYDYPTISLPLDTTVCKHLTVTLDAGTGFNKYLWSTQDTTQTVTLSVSQLGLGGTFVSVKVWQAGCMGKDSTLVFFKDCTSLTEADLLSNIEVYPNPSSSKLFIQMPEQVSIEQVSVMDQGGRVVMQERHWNSYLDVQALENGIYLLVIQSNRGMYRQKFIKH
jgi:hypothetical protein